MNYSYLSSPVGTLLLAGDEAGLHRVAFQKGLHPESPDEGWRPDAAFFRETARQLQAYFAGEMREFDLPLAPEGTPFEQAVWKALQEIPYGETRTYGDLARRVGRPTAPRAVGAANGRNPIPIIIPCHRVIGANGSLTGFGGGLGVKRQLLDLEQAVSGRFQARLDFGH